MRFKTARCKTCNAEIAWAITTTGKRMPVDVEPSANGNVMLRIEGEKLFAQIVSRDDPRPRHTSHFVTCPDADEWRLPPKGEALL